MAPALRHTITLRPRVQTAEESLRPTRAEIDLEAIAHNLGVVRQAAAGARVLAVVKADAYGHGVVPVAARLQREGVDGFGVALAEEGFELREAGIEREILVLNGVYGGAHREVIARNLTPVVYDLAEIEAFDRAAGDAPYAVHLKVDTGMSRLGVPVARLEELLARAVRFDRLRIEGVMTHLASADDDPEATREQLARFSLALEMVRRAGHRPSVVHAGNSAALFRHPEARYDMVRPGVALFGVPPAQGTGKGLRPAMRLRSEIIALRVVEAGTAIGYSGTFRAREEMVVATVPVGYGDGLLRSTSNRGHVLVGGLRCPIVGNVSMDLTTVDVTHVLDVAVGDEVILLGSQGGDEITAEEIASAAGTIMYEVLTNVSRRVPRFYR